jgi:hypothetical protein
MHSCCSGHLGCPSATMSLQRVLRSLHMCSSIEAYRCGYLLSSSGFRQTICRHRNRSYATCSSPWTVDEQAWQITAYPTMPASKTPWGKERTCGVSWARERACLSIPNPSLCRILTLSKCSSVGSLSFACIPDIESPTSVAENGDTYRKG